MPREIVWLPGALKDVARLRDFIQKKNPSAPSVQQMVNFLYSTVLPRAALPFEILIPYLWQKQPSRQ